MSNKVNIERLKFYADTKTEKNKFFCFKINSIMDLEARLIYFFKIMNIRAAWYECLDENRRVIENSKIDLNHFVDFKEVLFKINGC